MQPDLTAREKGPILSVSGLGKSFGHIQALKEVNLEIYEGEVMALVGDNGAGKSTLIKILSGVFGPDCGQICVAGRTFRRLTPAQSLKNGITAVYQDLALVDCRDVPCNVFLGREPTRAGFFIDKKRMAAETNLLLTRLKISIPSIAATAGVLSGGQRQSLAVARAINQGGRVIILDEPMAAMGVGEAAQVLELVGNLGRQGYAVIIISHNLHHVFSVSDRICVMRSGELIADLCAKDTSLNQVTELITGAQQKQDADEARDVIAAL